MPTARARHILVDSEAFCTALKEEIEEGKDFSDIAKQHSTCPSGSDGGDLGQFSQGQMVPEFDHVVFNEALHMVHGPIKTEFGYHLLEVTDRNDW